ncbi:MAG: putative regulatory protein, partial [Myxococcales bacterium]|nr:putative regulatory protein [Myxococcales bacterium]
MTVEPLPKDDLELLIGVLPATLQARVAELPGAELLEIIMDFGRRPEARLLARTVVLSDDPVTLDELQLVLSCTSAVGPDNRAGIERTLHRISAIRNRKGDVIGLTLRVGRAVFGTIDVLRDLIESGRNLLLLGRPGVGKTTKLREVARVLADELGRRVVVVDTSNEIGGDGDVPHPAIGDARRMQVPRPDRQHDVMIEAVENHMPEVIIVDEMGTAAEALAARTIAERGVQLIATAHGTTLENLVLNPTLSDVVGGIHTVTLSDEEARRRRTMKTITERRGPPTFDVVVEIVDREEVVVHRDTGAAVDRLLAGGDVGGERRRIVAGRMVAGSVIAGRGEREDREQEDRAPAVAGERGAPPVGAYEGPVRIHAYAVSRDLVERVLRDLPIEARVVNRADAADVVLALRSRMDDPKLRVLAERGVPIYAVKRNSSAEMRRVLRNAFAIVGGVDDDEVRDAVAEAEHAIGRVMAEQIPVALAPRPSELRKVQHRIASRYHLETVSMGKEPLR